MKKYVSLLIVTIVFTSNCVLFSQDSTITITNFGPYNIGIINKQKIIIEIKNLKVTNSEELCDRGDISLIVKNSTSEVIYDEKFALGGCFSISVDVDTLIGLGSCLQIVKNFAAAPPYDYFSQYYCFNKKGEFVPITGELYDAHYIRNLKIKGKSISVIESDEWTGQFYVTLYYKFHFNGFKKKFYEHIHQKKYKISIDSIRAAHCRSNENSTIDFFNCPDTNNCYSQKITINGNSKIKFLYAKRNNNMWWLCVLINDEKGYVKGYNDFSTLGLPMAG